MATRIHRLALPRSAIPGLQAMTLHSNHAFSRHSHDPFGIGVVAVGAQRSWSGIGWVESQAVAGVSRFQLLRGFARELGATPHAHLLQLRVRLARQRLACSFPPAEGRCAPASPTKAT
jgi:AraC-like DNA-binding protein